MTQEIISSGTTITSSTFSDPNKIYVILEQDEEGNNVGLTGRYVPNGSEP